MLDGLAETDPRIQSDLVAHDALLERFGFPVAQELDDFANDVVVMRRGLHGARLALHVHQHKPGSRGGGHPGHLRIAAQRGHIVDDDGPRRQRGSRDLGLGRIDRDRNVNPGAERFDDGDDAANFFLGVDGPGARPGRFSAHVDDVGSLGGHRLAVGHGSPRVEKPAPIAEGVRRDVEDPHDENPGTQVEPAPATLPDHQRMP